MRRNLKYHVKPRDEGVYIVEAGGRRRRAGFDKMLELALDSLDRECKYDLMIGSFNACAEIKACYSKPRSKRGHDKKKLDKWRDNLSASEVKKNATKKTTKPKIRSQKAGRRMVNLKGQPGC